jgi:hypothetical protein
MCGKWADEGGCDSPMDCETKAEKFWDEYAKQENEWEAMFS